MRSNRTIRRFSLAVVAVAASLHAQAPTQFDVASIKPNAPGDNRIQISTLPGGRFEATGVNVKMLIQQAWGVNDFQISGGPGWLGSERYDIQAKADFGGEFTKTQLRPMLQALLTDRFRLKVHRETKDTQSFTLLVNKAGSKLRAAANTPTAGPGEKTGKRGMTSMGRGLLQGNGITMTTLADMLSRQLGRVVSDKTGIAGNFDVDLKWSPDPGELAGMPSKGEGGPPPQTDTFGVTIYTALEEQLGLRLDSVKTPVEVLVIDSAEKASEN